jgi:hypothetical protein
MKGSFRDMQTMRERRSDDSVVSIMLRRVNSIFINDVTSEQILSAVRTFPDGVFRFIDREGIKSCAILVLKIGELEEIVGIMFVNYRTKKPSILKNKIL